MTKTTPIAAAALAGSALAATAGLAGCSPVNDTVTPGYTYEERSIEIRRNISMEGKLFLEDIDEHVLMWRPVTQLSYWNVRQMSP